MVVDQRWRLELALAAACHSFAPRPSDTIVPLLASSASASPDAAPAEPRYISYYSYRYL